MAQVDLAAKKREILSRLNIQAEFEELGVQTLGNPNAKGWLACRSPYREDKNPSCGINVGSDGKRGILCDFGYLKSTEPSNRGYAYQSLFDVSVNLGKFFDFKESFRHYAQKTGVRLSPKRPPSKDLIEKYQKNLTPEVIEHLKVKRSLNEESIKKYEIGWCLDEGYQERNSFPVYDEHDELVNIRFHNSKKKPKTLNMSGYGQARLWGIDRLTKLKSGSTTCISEGEFDAQLIEQETGFCCVSPTNGKGAFQQPWVDRFKGFHIVLVWDCDREGRETVQRLIIPLFKKAVQSGEILSLKVIWLYDKASKTEKDFTDFIVKSGGTGQQLIDLINETPPYIFKDHKADKLPKPVELSSFIDIDNDQFAGQRISVPLYVYGENSEAYHAVTKVNVNFCPLLKKSECTGRKDFDGACLEDIHVPFGHRVSLSAVAFSDQQLKGALRDFVCDQDKKPSITWTDADRLTIREVFAHQVIKPGTTVEVNELIEKPVYIIGGDLIPIGRYKATGFLRSHPRNQKPTILIDTLERQDEDWQSFDLEKSRTLLDAVQKCTPTEIVDDLSTNVTKIYERDDLHLGTLLTLCSPRWFNMPGEGRLRGWIESICIGDTGCHAKGTEILLANGHIKKVEDIVVGDKLIGPKGDIKTVQKLYRGKELMYKIIPNKGNPFTVNKSHVLAIQAAYRKNKTKWIRYHTIITVKKYLELNPTQQQIAKLYRSEVKEFKTQKIKFILQPYHLGLFLGDGSLQNEVSLHNQHEIIQKEVRKIANQFNLHITTYYQKNGNGVTLRLAKDPHGKKNNPLLDFFRSYGLDVHCKDKFIPYEYKTTSYNNRLELLAGLIDTDGHYCKKGKIYEYVSRSKRLASDICFVARSVGLCVTQGTKQVKGVTYFRLCISGDINKIPCKREKKQALERKINKNPLVTGFAVEPVGEDKYYGFEIGNDHLYLMGDFTVTHNTGKTTVTEQLFNHANVGYRVSGMTSSRTGITYSCDFDERRGWRIKAGALLKMSKQAIIVDEAQDLAMAELKTMAEAIDTGILRVDRIQNKTFESQTRCVFSCNPKPQMSSAEQKTMDSFRYGCQSIQGIFPKMMIRRMDLVLFATSYDIEDKDKVFFPGKNNLSQKITSDHLKALVHFAWNLQEDQIYITEEMADLIRHTSRKLAKKFGGCHDLPIVYPEDFRKTFARLCVAYAVLDLSTDDYQTVTVEEHHIDFVGKFIDYIYSADNANLHRYSQYYVSQHGLKNPEELAVKLINIIDIETITKYCREKGLMKKLKEKTARATRIKGIFKQLSESNGKDKLTQQNLTDEFPVDKRTIYNDMKFFKDNSLVKTIRGYLPTNKFFRFLTYLDRHYPGILEEEEYDKI